MRKLSRTKKLQNGIKNSFFEGLKWQKREFKKKHTKNLNFDFYYLIDTI